MSVHREGQDKRQQLGNSNAPQVEFTPSWVYCKFLFLSFLWSIENNGRNFHIQTNQTLTSKPISCSKENNSLMIVKDLRNTNVSLGFGRYELFPQIKGVVCVVSFLLQR